MYEILFYVPSSSGYVEFGVENNILNHSIVNEVPPNNAHNVLDIVEVPELIVLHSSAAGASTDLYSSIIKPILDYFKVKHTYVRTINEKTTAETAQQLDPAVHSTVLILGGDTSVHEFINNLPNVSKSQKASVNIAVIPTGSGNALASSVGLSEPVSAIREFFKRNYAPLSSFEIDFPDGTSTYAVVVASWGFHASLVADSEDLRDEFKHAPLERFKEAAKRLLQNEKQVYESNVYSLPDKSSILSTHAYLIFTLVSHLEPTFCISPLSNAPSDLNLQLVGIPPLNNQEEELHDIMNLAYQNGSHIHDSRVKYERINTAVGVYVYDQPERMRRWCIDGRIVISPEGEVVINRPSHVCRGWNLYTTTK